MGGGSGIRAVRRLRVWSVSTVLKVWYYTTRAIESEPARSAVHSPEPDSPNAAGLGSICASKGEAESG